MTTTDIIAGAGTNNPFLLNLRIENLDIPLDVTYDEQRSLSIVRDKDALPLVNSKYALGTHTKTKAKNETDDSD